MQEYVQQRLGRPATLSYLSSDVERHPNSGRSDIVRRDNSGIGWLSSEGILDLLATGEIDRLENSRDIDWE